MLASVNLFAGLTWDPGIRGILIVAVGVAVLMGSVYLIVGTNVGARLGLLVSLAGLFGFMVILTFIWWLQPPAIGPRGTNASWSPLEIYVNGPETALTESAQLLPQPQDLPQPDEILAENPRLAETFPNGFTLAQLADEDPELLAEYLDEESLNGWDLVRRRRPTSPSSTRATSPAPPSTRSSTAGPTAARRPAPRPAPMTVRCAGPGTGSASPSRSSTRRTTRSCRCSASSPRWPCLVRPRRCPRSTRTPR
jgi:hypothetical protein